MKHLLQNMYSNAVALNYRNIMSFFRPAPRAKFVDLGCDEGTLTLKMAKRIGTDDVYGVEIVPERAKQATAKGIKVAGFDLNGPFEYGDSTFDVVHANQVIEHLYNSDNFLAELFRILKPRGYAVISTENASSWCNLFAGLMGWQMFSLTNFSSKGQGIGNPVALHRGGEPNEASWNHVRIYNIRGLKEYFEAFGFDVRGIKGAGYFPLPGILGAVDTTHSHFITYRVEKPL